MTLVIRTPFPHSLVLLNEKFSCWIKFCSSIITCTHYFSEAKELLLRPHILPLFFLFTKLKLKILFEENEYYEFQEDSKSSFEEPSPWRWRSRTSNLNQEEEAIIFSLYFLHPFISDCTTYFQERSKIFFFITSSHHRCCYICTSVIHCTLWENK